MTPARDRRDFLDHGTCRRVNSRRDRRAPSSIRSFPDLEFLGLDRGAGNGTPAEAAGHVVGAIPAEAVVGAIPRFSVEAEHDKDSNRPSGGCCGGGKVGSGLL